MLRAIVLLVFITLIPFRSNAQLSKDCGKEVIEKSIKAMGGGELLRSIKNIYYEAQGFQYALEQSERYEGPYIPLFRKLKSTISFEKQKAYIEQSSTFPKSPTITMTTVIDSGVVAIKRFKKYFPHFYQKPVIKDELDYSIIALLLAAKAIPELTCANDTLIDGVSNHVVAFKLKGFPAKLYINASTSLITASLVQKPYDENYFSIWGDTKKYTYYSFWDLFENGLHFPLQQDVWMNGRHYQSTLIDKLEINQANLDSVSISPQVLAQAPELQKRYEQQFVTTLSGSKEIAKDVWFLPGPCNVTVVNQGKELIIIEAPMSSSYAKEIIKKAKEIFPGKRVTKVISTSDAWLHMGGLREFAVEGALIISLDANSRIVRDLLAAPYYTAPDALQLNKKEGSIKIVSTNLTLSGNIDVRVIPIRTEAGERMMMVYFPQYKLLYASDLFQPKLPNGKYWEMHYTYEVYQAIEREKLDVEKIYAMHSDLIPYVDLKKDLGVK